MNAHAAIIPAVALSATLDYAAFKQGLAFICKTIERKNTIPILSAVLIKECDGGVSLIATDLDMLATASVSGKAAPGFVAAINALALKAAVDKVKKASTIHLSRGDSTVAVTIGDLSLSFEAMRDVDFPVEQTFRSSLREATVSFLLPTDAFAKALGKVELAVSSEETRYYLNGVYMHIAKHEQEFRLIATDGHKMARYSLPIPAGAGAMSDKGAIIPRKTIGLLRHLLRGKDLPEHVMVTVTEKAVSFLVGEDNLLESKLIDGEFPDYSRVTPLGNEYKVGVSRGPLIAALRNVSSVARRGGAVRLDFGQHVLAVSCNVPDTGRASAEVSITSGPMLSIGFNGQYLLEIASALDGGVMFEMQDRDSPALIRDGADDAAVFVLMPMRV